MADITVTIGTTGEYERVDLDLSAATVGTIDTFERVDLDLSAATVGTIDTFERTYPMEIVSSSSGKNRETPALYRQTP